MYKVKLTEFVKKMNLKSLLPDIDTDMSCILSWLRANTTDA